MTTARPTPYLLVYRDRLEANLRRMQKECDAHGVQLWPHIKTHKSVAVARLQLQHGAKGLTCAKLSEAEAILPSGVENIFVAHSLVTPEAMDRVAALQKKLKRVIIAATSIAHARVLAKLTRQAGLQVEIAIAVDTGLHREGLRTIAEATELKSILAENPQLRPVAIYTHEGFSYTAAPEKHQELINEAHALMMKFRAALGGDLPLWPGCSVTAALFARMPHVEVVRPGAYPFGDIYLWQQSRTHRREEVALVVRTCVVDRPAADLALIDAGSKTFSGDKTPEGVSGRAADGRKLDVTRVNEEHGYVTGPDVDRLVIGDLVDFIPTHICPVVNLARQMVVTGGNQPDEIWPIEASGCNF